MTAAYSPAYIITVSESDAPNPSLPSSQLFFQQCVITSDMELSSCSMNRVMWSLVAVVKRQLLVGFAGEFAKENLQGESASSFLTAFRRVFTDKVIFLIVARTTGRLSLSQQSRKETQACAKCDNAIEFLGLKKCFCHHYCIIPGICLVLWL